MPGRDKKEKKRKEARKGELFPTEVGVGAGTGTGIGGKDVDSVVQVCLCSSSVFACSDTGGAKQSGTRGRGKVSTRSALYLVSLYSLFLFRDSCLSLCRLLWFRSVVFCSVARVHVGR